MNALSNIQTEAQTTAVSLRESIQKWIKPLTAKQAESQQKRFELVSPKAYVDHRVKDGLSKTKAKEEYAVILAKYRDCGIALGLCMMADSRNAFSKITETKTGMKTIQLKPKSQAENKKVVASLADENAKLKARIAELESTKQPV